MDVGEKTLQELQKKQTELKNSSEKLYLIQAGQINHEKYNLINEILQIKDKGLENVYALDAPGLDTDINGNEKAFSIYKNANFIFFVCDPMRADLHQMEWQNLDTAANWVGKKYFWNHIAFIFVLQQEIAKVDLEIVEKDILNRIQKSYNVKKIRFFTISIADYEKWIIEKNTKDNQNFLEQSGAYALLQYIREEIPKWEKENVELKQKRFYELYEQATEDLLKERCKLENQMHERKENFQIRCNTIQEEFRNAMESIEEYEDEIYYMEENVEKLKCDIDSLIKQHEAEKF